MISLMGENQLTNLLYSKNLDSAVAAQCEVTGRGFIIATISIFLY